MEIKYQRGCVIKWFKHDSDANRDAKLQKVIMKYGLEGYGLYWYCIELIAGNIEVHNLSFELEHDSELLSYHTKIHQERLEEMMEFFIRLGLFESANGVVTCLKIAKRLDQSMTSNKELRKQIAVVHQLLPNRGINGNHDGVMTESCQSHDRVMQEEKRREEKRQSITPSRDDVFFAEQMFELVRDVNPRQREPNIDDWANTIRLMRERDNTDLNQMRKVFKWANKNEFWSTNILCPKKFRKQFDKLILAMNKEEKSGKKSAPSYESYMRGAI